MTNLLSQLKEVERLLDQRSKHLPGQHDQSKHAGDRGGAGGLDAAMNAAKKRPDVKKYFNKETHGGDTAWAEYKTLQGDRGGKEVQEMTVYEGKDADQAGKFMVRIHGGTKGGLNTWASTAWHDTAAAAIDESLSDKHSAHRFLTPVSD